MLALRPAEPPWVEGRWPWTAREVGRSVWYPATSSTAIEAEFSDWPSGQRDGSSWNSPAHAGRNTALNRTGAFSLSLFQPFLGHKWKKEERGGVGRVRRQMYLLKGFHFLMSLSRKQ